MNTCQSGSFRLMQFHVGTIVGNLVLPAQANVFVFYTVPGGVVRLSILELSSYVVVIADGAFFPRSVD